MARALLGPGGARDIERVWDGVEATRFRPTADEISVPALSNHLVVLHLGPPAEVAQTVDSGRPSRSLVRTGGSAVLPAGAASHWCWAGRGASRADSLHLYLAPALIREAAESLGVNPDRVEIPGGLLPHDPQIERIGLSILPELGVSEHPGGGLFVESLARALAIYLVRERSTLGRVARLRTGSEPAGGLSRGALGRATDYVGDNLTGDLALSKIARAAHASPFHFSRLFKASTGLSPHQYVIRRRVERARELLVSTDLPLHEVAEASGFADQSHMGRHLKRLLGVTPVGVRRG